MASTSASAPPPPPPPSASPAPSSPSASVGQKRKLSSAGVAGGGAAGRTRAFQRSHARKFGLEVVGRDAESGAVTAALCLFCKHFGREERAGKKRRPTARFKYFRQSFRTDLYVQHHSTQHPALWARYDALADDDERKRSFFPAQGAAAAIASAANASAAGAGGPGTPGDDPQRPPLLLREQDVAEAAAAARRSPDQRRLWFEVDAAIVELLVGPAGWRARGFRACSRGLSPVRGRSVYRVGLPAREPLELALELLAAGLRPRQAARALQAAVPKRLRAADDPGPPRGPAPPMGPAELADLARLCVAASLEHLGALLAASPGFSLEVRSVRAGGSTAAAAGDVLLEVRAALYAARAADVLDFHLVAFPDASARGAAALGAAVASLLDAMLPSAPVAWRSRVLGVAADGLGPDDPATQLAQWLRDHASGSSSDPDPRVRTLPVRAWVAAPHVHRALERFYESLQGGAFLPTWRRLVARIDAEPELVQIMGRPPSAARAALRSLPTSRASASACSPRRWLDLGRDAKWVTDKRVRLRKALEERRDRAENPPDAWWVFFFVANWVAGRAEDALERLAARPQAAAAAVADLAAEIGAAFRAQAVPLPLAAVGDVQRSRAGRYAVAIPATREFVDDLGLFVSNLAARVEAAAFDRVLADVAQAVAELVDALVELSGCDLGPLDASSALLPTTPKDLAALNARELAAQLAPLAALLAGDEEARDALDQEHQALRRAAGRNGASLAAADAAAAADPCASAFERAWAPTGGRFPKLQALAGAVATVHSASERLGDLWERGLAIPGRRYGRDAEEDDGLDADALSFAQLADVVDLAAEAALHAQQFARLEELAAPQDEGETDAER